MSVAKFGSPVKPRKSTGTRRLPAASWAPAMGGAPGPAKRQLGLSACGQMSANTLAGGSAVIATPTGSTLPASVVQVLSSTYSVSAQVTSGELPEVVPAGALRQAAGNRISGARHGDCERSRERFRAEEPARVRKHEAHASFLGALGEAHGGDLEDGGVGRAAVDAGDAAASTDVRVEAAAVVAQDHEVGRRAGNRRAEGEIDRERLGGERRARRSATRRCSPTGTRNRQPRSESRCCRSPASRTPAPRGPASRRAA